MANTQTAKTKRKASTPRGRSQAAQASTFSLEIGATLFYDMEDFDRKDHYQFEVTAVAPELRVAWRSHDDTGKIRVPAKARAKASLLTASFDESSTFRASDALPVFLLGTDAFAALRDSGRATVSGPDGSDTEIALRRLGQLTIEVNGSKREISAVFAKPTGDDAALSLAILDDRTWPIVLRLDQEDDTYWKLSAASGVRLEAAGPRAPPPKPAPVAKPRMPAFAKPDWTAVDEAFDKLAASKPLARFELVFENKTRNPDLMSNMSEWIVGHGAIYLATNKQIYRLRGRKLSPIVEASFPRLLSVVGDRLLWWENPNNVMRITADRGKPKVVVRLPDEAGVAFTDGNLWFWRCYQGVGIMRGGKSKKLVRNARDIIAATAAEGRAYYVDRTGKAVFAISSGGGEPQRLAKVPYPRGHLCVAGGYLYWVDADPAGSVGSVMRCRLADGALERLILTCKDVEGFAVDDNHVYLALSIYNYPAPPKTLFVRYPLDGSQPAVVASLDGHWSQLVIDEGWLYAGEDHGAIARVRLPRPASRP